MWFHFHWPSNRNWQIWFDSCLELVSRWHNSSFYSLPHALSCFLSFPHTHWKYSQTNSFWKSLGNSYPCSPALVSLSHTHVSCVAWFSLAQSIAAAVTSIMPAISHNDDDSTVGIHAQWCWLKWTLQHFWQRQTFTYMHTQQLKILTTCRPINNSSPAVRRVRHQRHSLWVYSIT